MGFDPKAITDRLAAVSVHVDAQKATDDRFPPQAGM